MNTPTTPTTTTARAEPLHAELRRFAMQVQGGFVLMLAMCLVMLAIQG